MKFSSARESMWAVTSVLWGCHDSLAANWGFLKEVLDLVTGLVSIPLTTDRGTQQ